MLGFVGWYSVLRLLNYDTLHGAVHSHACSNDFDLYKDQSGLREAGMTTVFAFLGTLY